MKGKIKLITTADDYGVIKEIDDGIIEAIKAGSINTVSIIVNFRRCKSSLKKLITFLNNEGLIDKVGLGIHLNITMGSPVSPISRVKSLVGTNNKFYTYRTYQASINFERFDFDEIKREATGQVQIYLKYIDAICKDMGLEAIPIDHISSHFNLFNSIDKFAHILVDLCTSFKKFGKKKTLPIPVRRPLPLFIEYKDYSKRFKKLLRSISKPTNRYIISNNLSLEAIMFKIVNLSKRKLIKIINDILIPNKVRCTHGMFFSYYANAGKPSDLLPEFRSVLSNVRAALLENGNIHNNADIYIELVHHVSTPVSKQRYKQIRITGFDKRYLKKFRFGELKLVTSQDYIDLFKIKGVSTGRYSDMISPKVNIVATT